VVGDMNENEHVKEKKIVYNEGESVRVLRGTITGEDEIFVYIHRNDGDRKINKKFIIIIEEANHDR
jgi:hypothetical protein